VLRPIGDEAAAFLKGKGGRNADVFSKAGIPNFISLIFTLASIAITAPLRLSPCPDAAKPL
jgi:hypothetical protein